MLQCANAYNPQNDTFVTPLRQGNDSPPTQKMPRPHWFPARWDTSTTLRRLMPDKLSPKNQLPNVKGYKRPINAPCFVQMPYFSSGHTSAAPQPGSRSFIRQPTSAINPSSASAHTAQNPYHNGLLARSQRFRLSYCRPCWPSSSACHASRSCL
jgi:hypothetical protein